MTELWFQNPYNYIRELVEVAPPVTRIIWTYGQMHKLRMDPLKHANTYLAGRPWEIILIGQQGAAHYDQDCSGIKNPKAVYPVFSYPEDIEILEEICQNNIGDNPDYTEDDSLNYESRPIAGQDHRIFCNEIPNLAMLHGRAYARELAEMQSRYPDAKLHIAGTSSWKTVFGMGFYSGDLNPRFRASGGEIEYYGKHMRWERAKANPHIALQFGFKPVDLGIPRNRCMYNIKSSLWSAENWHKQTKVNLRSDEPVDIESPTVKLPERRTPLIGLAKTKPGDKIACDDCSLSEKCTYYREGSVCTLPKSESSELARMFNTRDSDLIIQALGKLLEKQSNRLEKAEEEEELYGELSPQVDKIAQFLFSNGVKLAKLVNPALNSPSVSIGINTNGGAAAVVAEANPKKLIAAITHELVAGGIPLNEITPPMIKAVLQGAGTNGGITPNVRQAIEGTVIDHES